MVNENPDNLDANKKIPWESSDNQKEDPKERIHSETHELTNALKDDLKNIEEWNDRDEAEQFMWELLSSDKHDTIWDNGRAEFLSSKKIGTEHIRYEYVKRFFPLFVAKCESSRLWKNPLLDVAALGVGVVDSSIQIASLVIHLLIDTLKILGNPVGAYRHTENVWKNNNG